VLNLRKILLFVDFIGELDPPESVLTNVWIIHYGWCERNDSAGFGSWDFEHGRGCFWNVVIYQLI
jgi:hypothetical protein